MSCAFMATLLRTPRMNRMTRLYWEKLWMYKGRMSDITTGPNGRGTAQNLIGILAVSLLYTTKIPQLSGAIASDRRRMRCAPGDAKYTQSIHGRHHP